MFRLGERLVGVHGETFSVERLRLVLKRKELVLAWDEDLE